MEIVGGIVAIVVGVIMLIIGGSVLNAVTVGDGIGNCEAQDYNGDGFGLGVAQGNHTKKADGTTAASSDADKKAAKTFYDGLDKATAAYKQCNATKNNAYTVLNFMSVMFIISGVIITIRGIGMGG